MAEAVTIIRAVLAPGDGPRLSDLLGRLLLLVTSRFDRLVSDTKNGELPAEWFKFPPI